MVMSMKMKMSFGMMCTSVSEVPTASIIKLDSNKKSNNYKKKLACKYLIMRVVQHKLRIIFCKMFGSLEETFIYGG
jgi:hypothetical protein